MRVSPPTLAFFFHFFIFDAHLNSDYIYSNMLNWVYYKDKDVGHWAVLDPLSDLNNSKAIESNYHESRIN